MKKVLLVFGTRPEAIKMAPICLALKEEPDKFERIVCVTAQHRDMLDQVLEVFKIKADIDLDLMKSGQDLFDITSAVLLAMRSVIEEQRPDLVMVHGDTTTTLAAATACFYKNIPVWHVEAGLRTYDMGAPFPEEFNRQVVSKISQVHLAPTALAKANLLAEGIKEEAIFVTGNTVIDALHLTLNTIEKDLEKKSIIIGSLSHFLPFDWRHEKFVLITGHRRENFGDGFQQICLALLELAKKFPQVKFVYPVHLNPNVQKPVNELLQDTSNVFLIPPLEYESFIYLLNFCCLVLTDSGGIQEEAPSLGKPVLVMREKTERPEGVTAGTVILVGAKREKIVQNVSRLLDDPKASLDMSNAHNPYGDGLATKRIMSALEKNII
jgi:UDP-N-acetylglucosamine 2-epimerase (non-hydrolysing)